MNLERPILQRWLPTELLDHLDLPPGHKLSGFFACYVLKSGADSYLIGCVVPVAADQFLSLYLHGGLAIANQILPGISPPLASFPDGAIIPFSRLEEADTLPEWIAQLQQCPLLQTPLGGEKLTYQDRRGSYPVFRVTSVG